MKIQREIATSNNGDGNGRRRVQGNSHFTMMAYLLDPAWKVGINDEEKAAVVVISDSSYGDRVTSDEDVLELQFTHAPTLRELVQGLTTVCEELEALGSSDEQG